jgi:class I fructose-bisphosphate aldolase
MMSGAAGIIFGRNLWQRPYDDALALSRDAHEILRRYPS